MQNDTHGRTVATSVISPLVIDSSFANDWTKPNPNRPFWNRDQLNHDEAVDLCHAPAVGVWIKPDSSVISLFWWTQVYLSSGPGCAASSVLAVRIGHWINHVMWT